MESLKRDVGLCLLVFRVLLMFRVNGLEGSDSRATAQATAQATAH